MSDLISRSELLKALSEAEDNYRTEHHDCVVDDDPFSDGILSAMFFVSRIVKRQPTAYSVDKVVEKLEERKALHERLVDYETKNGTVTEKYQHIKVIDVLNDTIGIVKQGGVDVANNATTKNDDVCEWKAIGANDNWSTSCDKNSTHNVFGVAWFNRCPYCGRKLKIVGD